MLGSKRQRNGQTDTLRLPTSRKPRVLLIGDPKKERAIELTGKLEKRLEGKANVVGVELVRNTDPIQEKPDLIIVLGGDGAMLATAHRLDRRTVPVMGINLGRVGFLAAVSPERALTVLDEVLTGKGLVEVHAMMNARIRRGSDVVLDTHLLNEVVVMRTWGASMVEIDLHVDRRPVCTYRGDGLIVSTATGSTAYSLAAGGPVLSPRLDAWVVTPIAPYALNMRPVVLPGERVATLKVHQESGFTADGHVELRLEADDTVRVGPSSRRFHLVVDPRANFFARLRSKLLWGIAPTTG